MYTRLSSAAAVVFAATVTAQTFSVCNPLKVDPSTCKVNPAFGGTANIDFTQGESSLFSASTGTSVNYGENGAEVTIDSTGQAPTFTSTKYMFFGTVDVTLRVSKGSGIITTIVLESDVLDEIDWEWRGGVNGMVQANYFSKGDTASYGQLEQDITIPGGDDVETFHTYSLDWSPERLQWIIDGTVYRTLTYAGNENTYPQTPMMVKFGTWCAGCSTAPGTVEWAGGAPDWSQAPFTAYYKSIDIKDNANGVANAESYEYTDQTGSMASIKVNTGSGSSSSDNSNSDTSSVASNRLVNSAQSTATTLSTATSEAAATTTADSPIGQATGPAEANAISTNTAASSSAASTTTASASSGQTSAVTAGAHKSAVNFAFVGAAMFALFCV
ncbi:unnamed protein product [Discula destructiva]